ncbi:hypothetical protein DWQ65_04515 [Treponema phagedenis]|uniref:Uncharacterized protein n=1 Tax=Treponema phagedenis TaxID=162 RepID=A0AAE6M901_TREPH|nr:hypothetical protein FUT79_07675 [Treponema phagedenis]QEJ99630.1 hypothetical protein FUT82_09670 [Treponema phagedenis]QEK02249.1 hypothetical protein FUT84_07520 [Treponema phagedenis]QEK05183.1 hypothetical protein FUT83_07980 [Treponema phagedenis]QEK07838.1 hypothetical protein FUT80_04415 [Treponema phagedenis]
MLPKHKKFYKKEFDTAQGRTLGISTSASPTSFKASMLGFCVDALKHRLEFCKGEQCTIGILKSAVPYC